MLLTANEVNLFVLQLFGKLIYPNQKGSSHFAHLPKLHPISSFRSPDIVAAAVVEANQVWPISLHRLSSKVEILQTSAKAIWP